MTDWHKAKYYLVVPYKKECSPVTNVIDVHYLKVFRDSHRLSRKEKVVYRVILLQFKLYDSRTIYSVDQNVLTFNEHEVMNGEIGRVDSSLPPLLYRCITIFTFVENDRHLQMKKRMSTTIFLTFITIFMSFYHDRGIAGLDQEKGKQVAAICTKFSSGVFAPYRLDQHFCENEREAESDLVLQSLSLLPLSSCLLSLSFLSCLSLMKFSHGCNNHFSLSSDSDFLLLLLLETLTVIPSDGNVIFS